MTRNNGDRDCLPIGPYKLDRLRHVLDTGRGQVSLSPLASRFLQALARRPGEVVARSELIQDLWRGDFLVGEPALSRVVSETRRAVGDNARDPRLIQTVHRLGYRLVAADLAPAGDETPNPAWVRIWRYGLITLSTITAVAVVLVALGLVARHLR